MTDPHTLDLPTLLFLASLPLISALIGWLTNKVAIFMLFHPRKRRPLLGQGLIPRRQPELASRAGELVEERLLQRHVLRAEIAKMDLRPALEDAVSQTIRGGMAERLKQLPLIGGFVNAQTIALLEKIAREEIRRRGPMLAEAAGKAAEEHLDIRKLVKTQVASLDLDELEAAINRIARSELRHIELLGGVLGFIVGLVQVLLLIAVGLL